MSESKRNLADWIWSLVGIAGIAFIIVAILMLVVPRFTSDPVKEDPVGAARELWAGAKEKLSAGDAEGAVRDLKQALALVNGRHPVYLNDLGEALMQAGKEDEAPANWAAAIGCGPFYAQPYLNLARWHDARGQHGAALARYRAALALHPEPVPANLAARVAELMSEFEQRRDEELARISRSLHANPADLEAFTVLLLAELAVLRVEEGATPAAGLRAAIEKIAANLEGLDDLVLRQESAAADRPDSVVDQAGLGTVLLLSGESARAASVFSTALQLSDTDRMSNLGASLSALLSGDFSNPQIAGAARGLKVNLVALQALGVALIEEGNLPEARKVLLAALQLNPSLPETYRLLALTFTGEGEEKDRAAALRGYERLAR